MRLSSFSFSRNSISILTLAAFAAASALACETEREEDLVDPLDDLDLTFDLWLDEALDLVKSDPFSRRWICSQSFILCSVNSRSLTSYH